MISAIKIKPTPMRTQWARYLNEFFFFSFFQTKLFTFYFAVANQRRSQQMQKPFISLWIVLLSLINFIYIVLSVFGLKFTREPMWIERSASWEGWAQNEKGRKN